MWLVVSKIKPKYEMIHFTLKDSNVEYNAFVNLLNGKWLHINIEDHILNVRLSTPLTKDMFSDESTATRYITQAYQEGFCVSQLINITRDSLSEKSQAKSFLDKNMYLKNMSPLHAFDERLIHGFA